VTLDARALEPRRRVVPVQVTAVRGERWLRLPESLAAEEPLEIRVAFGGRSEPLGITMRTPGHDFELAAGFVLGEGVLPGQEAIASVRYCTDEPAQRYNAVTVDSGVPVALDGAARRFPISSACGVCGSSSVEEVLGRCPPSVGRGPDLARSLLVSLPDRLRAGQEVFDRTGGLHGAGLFDTTGEMLVVREDIGRHNAVDKVVGWAALRHHLPLSASVLAVSGRLGFEIVQKAAVAGIPAVVAVSAPSSLAVELARRVGMTVVAFVRGERANLYSGEDRVVLDA